MHLINRPVESTASGLRPHPEKLWALRELNTYRAYKPQAESRRDPLSGVDSTVNPHCIFGPLFFFRNLLRENQKTIKKKLQDNNVLNNRASISSF